MSGRRLWNSPADRLPVGRAASPPAGQLILAFMYGIG